MDAILGIIQKLSELDKSVKKLLLLDNGTMSRGITVEVTTAGEVINRTRFCRVKPNADASSDNVDTIIALNDGLMMVLSPYTTGKTLTFRDNVGNLSLSGDCTLDNPADTLTVMYNAELLKWVEISRSNNT